MLGNEKESTFYGWLSVSIQTAYITLLIKSFEYEEWNIISEVYSKILDKNISYLY